MTRRSNKEVIDLNPVYKGASIKIDKVTISFEKSQFSQDQIYR